MRFTVVALLIREGWCSEATARVMLATSEALSNAIDHGSTADGEIEVVLSADGDGAELVVRDQGRPDADLPALPVAPPPPDSPDGRGLLIIQRLAERVRLRPCGTGSELVADFPARERARQAA